jgi:formate transporter
MTEQVAAQQVPIFNFNAYSPVEIEQAIEKVGVTKANLPFVPCLMLGVIAGACIGLGALYYTVIASDAALSFAATRALGGLVFCLGLTIVIVGGAELFTGNNLIVMAWASARITTAQLLRNWAIVWIGNLVGGAGLAILVLCSHHFEMNGGRVATAMLAAAVAKISPSWVVLLFKGCLCNLLVCLAVWLAAAGRSVADKILALIFPVSAFVAAGFEHSVANMYFLSMAWLLTATGNVPAGFDASLITIPGVAYNLFWVTIGNIVGGAVLVGFTYWVIYHKGLGVGRVKPSLPARA